MIYIPDHLNQSFNELKLKILGQWTFRSLRLKGKCTNHEHAEVVS